MNIKNKILCTAFTATLTVTFAWAQGRNVVKGMVREANGTPLAGANIYIYGTTDGALCDSLGRFSFQTASSGEVTVKCTFIGFADYVGKLHLPLQHDVDIRLKPQAVTLDNVEIVAGNFNFGRGNLATTMNSLDVVMSGNSCGDIFGSLHSLPGVQTVGENGRLYVRGGESSESQTFINGMHVLQPYDAEAGNTVTRSRFSPFLFKGINFALDGYDAQYGQALSSVLVMETTDVQTHDKLGVNFSPLSAAAGGTKSFGRSSLSFNAEYMDLKLYNKVFPDKYDWTKPYNKMSAQMQYKVETSQGGSIKTYAGFDHTRLGYHIPQDFFETNERDLGITDDNLYLNSVWRTTTAGGWRLFAGGAWSWVRNGINGALVNGDEYVDTKNEVHLKAYLQKAFGGHTVAYGVEDYIRNFQKRSVMGGATNKLHMNYNLVGAFVDTRFKLLSELFLKASFRMENQVSRNGIFIVPRVSLSYVPNNRFQMSLLAGEYSQVVGDGFDIYGDYIRHQSFSDHYVLSMQYGFARTTLRMETYLKYYYDLPMVSGTGYTFNGKGRSRGVDIFIEDNSISPRLTTMLAYSYNFSKRKYMQYDNWVQPQYTTRHNASLSIKYNVPQIKCIFGLSQNFASGRPYTDPSKPGQMQFLTKPYLSTGINVSFLASPSVIVYASATNLFNRHNVFNYQYKESPAAAGGFVRRAVEASRDRFFYIGVFISLKKSHAYEISNF